MMSRIDSQHWKISTSHHFQNGHHNATQIQHCPISTPFHMWVDYDVPNLFLLWNRTMLNFCGIVAAILKMETGRNFSMSGINSGHHNHSTLFDFNDISHVGRLWCPELIPDIEKFLPVAIFKMATTMPHKFHIVWFQRPELIPDISLVEETRVPRENNRPTASYWQTFQFYI
jgi:hypothetical protein